MNIVLGILLALVIWGMGYAAGAREATRRAEQRAARYLSGDDFGQTQIPHLMQDGSVYYEVVNNASRK